MIEETLVFIPDRYDGPEALEATPSVECKRYHENSYIKFNTNEEQFLRKIHNQVSDNDAG